MSRMAHNCPAMAHNYPGMAHNYPAMAHNCPAIKNSNVVLNKIDGCMKLLDTDSIPRVLFLGRYLTKCH